MFEESEHKFGLDEDKGYCDEEQEYNLISEGPEGSEDSIETPRLGHNYITPTISPEVRYRVSSPERTTNTDNIGTVTDTMEGISLLNPLPEDPDANSMVGAYIRLPTFNGNGAEYPEQHWFLCKVVWMVLLVHKADIKKAQMIMTLWGRTLDWFMKFCVVPVGTPQNTLDEI